jgi:hypothetical protein
METGLSVPPSHQQIEEKKIDLKKLVIYNINHLVEFI